MKLTNLAILYAKKHITNDYATKIIQSINHTNSKTTTTDPKNTLKGVKELVPNRLQEKDYQEFKNFYNNITKK